MKRFLIIDAFAILHRSFHALPPLSLPNGQLTNAVYGYTSVLLKVINDFSPNFLVVAFDRPEPTFRKKMYTQYQATRPETDKGLVSQIDLVRKVTQTIGVPIYEMSGFEADDIIGTIVTKISDKNIESIIVTGDRDILQLVSEKVKVYMPYKGISEGKIYSKKEVEDLLGVKPEQVIDYKALVGDSSDNYPGVNGIGPKTAGGLIVKYGSLMNIYKHLAEIENKKVVEKLTNGKNDADISLKLATIARDVPIDFELKKCQVPDLTRVEIMSLFEELNFRSLIKRIKFSTFENNQQVKKSTKKDDKNEQISLF
jgi:DNA polymerase-1